MTGNDVLREIEEEEAEMTWEKKSVDEGYEREWFRG